MAEILTIDDRAMPVEAPASAAALAELVQRCATTKTAVYPVGGAVGIDYGLPPARTGIAVAMSQLCTVIDYPARDLTITVEAGITLAKLSAILAAENQRLPIDVPFPERATLGGAISVDAAGPRRLGYGRFRDWIIGMTVVNGLGELCAAGGRVVKNVAGYDLPKLYTGSLGTLGVITQVTLKLQPVPGKTQWAAFSIEAADIAAVLDLLFASPTRPMAVELLNDGETWQAAVLYEDNPDSVDWQLDELKRAFPSAIAPASGEAEFGSSPAVASCPFALLATMPPSAVRAFLNAIHRPGMLVQAHALSGVARIGLPVADLATIRDLQQAALRHVAGGNAVIRRCPTEWKSKLPVWGRPPASLALMQRVKREFDPADILNPGRMHLPDACKT